MDISVASTAEPAERTGKPDEPAAEAGAARPQPHYPRTGSSLPTGPDPAVIFKYVKWGGVAAILIVAGLVLKSLMSGGPDSGSNPAPPTASAPASSGQNITLVANDAVVVRVVHKNPDGSEGAEIVRNTTLRAGQTLSVPWTAPIYIHASAGENLVVEWKGRRFPTGFTGTGRAQMAQPSR